MDQIMQKLVPILSEQLGVPVSGITEASRLGLDLGADELDIVALTMAIEDGFGIELDEEEVFAPSVESVTVGQLAQRIGDSMPDCG